MFRLLLSLTLIGLALSFPSPSDKIAPQLQSKLANGGKFNVVIAFSQETSPIINSFQKQTFASRTDLLTSLKVQLESIQQQSQKNVLSLLELSSSNYKSFWVNNRIYLKDATPELLSSIAKRPEVVEIREESVFHIGQKSEIEQLPENSKLAEWNIERIEAHNVWAMPGGNTGEGVVVGVLDTGVRATHEALRNNYRADYGWFDGIAGVATPIDPYNHGTAAAGIVAGAGGIGVAPGAQWIACRLYDAEGFSPESASIACGQWVLCPTRPNGTNPDCSKAPIVTANSWGGAGNNTWFMEVLDAWHAANIVGLFAAGNEGTVGGCMSVRSPGDYAKAITVGATSRTETAMSWTSLGPSAFGFVKPDVAAPGELSRSAGSGSDREYYNFGGTSGATPHVAGVAALLKSRNRNLTNDQVRQLLQTTTEQNLGKEGRVCGDIPRDVFPNNVYGHGRVNARRAMERAIGI